MIRLLSQPLRAPTPRRDGCSRPAGSTAGRAPHAPDEAEVHAQGPVDAGAVDAQEDPVGDTGPARVLGAAVEARLKRKQRDSQVETTALPLRHPLPQLGGPGRSAQALPKGPCPATPTAGAARPGAHRGPVGAQAAASEQQPGTDSAADPGRSPLPCWPALPEAA